MKNRTRLQLRNGIELTLENVHTLIGNARFNNGKFTIFLDLNNPLVWKELERLSKKFVNYENPKNKII